MSDSIENKLRNLSKAVKKPEPTLFYTAEPMQDGSGGGKGPGGPNPNTGSNCWSDIAGNPPAPWTSTAWGWTMHHVYPWIIGSMYCRRSPFSDDIRFCNPVYPGSPVDDSIEGQGQVTTRDEPLIWQRLHPDFDPTNPSTWGSLFDPGGLVDSHVRYWNCYGNTGECPGLTDADIRKAVDAIKELWIRRCGFAVVESGACCFPAGDFGGFSCAQANSEADCAALGGTFYSGQTCQQIGGDNCGLAPLPPEGPLPPVALNPQKAKSQTLAAKEIAAAVIRKLKGK